MNRFLPALLVLAAFAGCDAAVEPLPVCPPSLQPRAGGGLAEYVVHISVDGLRPDAVSAQLGALPAFARLRAEGTWTDNARTDADRRYTLPNHTDEMTGRRVYGPDGHSWTDNTDPDPGVTLHSRHGSYVASVFDVAHDAGLETAAYVSKSKFSLYDVSYDADHGAPDITGVDDGPDKIDRYVYLADTEALTSRIVADLAAAPAAYTFVHLRDPDTAGHASGWDLTPGSPYLLAVAHADALVGLILAAIESDPRLAGRTAVVLTADHGGHGTSHGDELADNYTIPFYVWGPGVRPGDLYALNPLRADPGMANVGWDAAHQPVRNGDAANLSLSLLGLGPVPGSTITPGAPLGFGTAVGTEAGPLACAAPGPTP